jgi:hypothetical protein
MYDGICTFLSPSVHHHIALKDFAAPWIQYGENSGEIMDQDMAVVFSKVLGFMKEECEDRWYVFVGLQSDRHGVLERNAYDVFSGRMVTEVLPRRSLADGFNN